jgi:transposase InsO family protein
VNHKRIQRLCRDEGLRVLRRPKKRYRVGFSTVPADRLRATYPDQVWAIDFLFDQTADLRTLKILAITDEFTKEALAIEVDRSIDADHTVRVLDCIVARTGRRPELLRMDNGPELTANAFGTGVGSPELAPPTSNLEAPGRTPSSSRSTAN